MRPRVMIIGANRGLGLEFARQFNAEGNEVWAVCRAPDHATELKALMRGNSGRVLQLDVADEAGISDLGHSFEGPLDLLVLNAGIFGPMRQALGELCAEEWLRAFRINTVGPALLLQALRPNLGLSRNGKVAVISSQLGSTSQTRGGRYIYRSSKAALNNTMASLARDIAAEGISLGVYHPGWVRTDMGGSDAPLLPAESVTALRAHFCSLHTAITGRYWDWNGRELPW